MAVVDLKKLCLFGSVRKKLMRSLVVIPDKPNLGAGFKPTLECGVYQMRRSKAGSVCVREKFYQPSDQTQPNKILSQLRFAAAVQAWQELTAVQKARYKRLAVGRHMSGYNLFIRDFMHG
jgi:hypothetical protein